MIRGVADLAKEGSLLAALIEERSSRCCTVIATIIAITVPVSRYQEEGFSEIFLVSVAEQREPEEEEEGNVLGLGQFLVKLRSSQT